MGNPALRGEIQNRVLAVVREILAIEDEPIGLDTAIVEDLATDSVAQISLYMALEDEFGGTIPQQEIKEIKTVRHIVDYIEGRLQTA